MSRPAPERGAAGRRRARRRGPTLLSALLGAGLLVVLGFALGIVAGLMMEEPQLLLDYVTGKTHSVAVVPGPRPIAGGTDSGQPALGAAPSAPDVASRGAGEAAPAAPEPPAPAAARAAPPEARPQAPASAAAPEPAPSVDAAPPAPSPAPGRGFSVQVGAFADAAPAEQLARKLESQGFPVYVAPAAGSDTRKWRVRVGPLADRGEAERVAERLGKREKLPTWVMAEGAP